MQVNGSKTQNQVISPMQENINEKYEVQKRQAKSWKNRVENMLNANTKAQGNRTNWQSKCMQYIMMRALHQNRKAQNGKRETVKVQVVNNTQADNKG